LFILTGFAAVEGIVLALLFSDAFFGASALANPGPKSDGRY
jgi:hypothetical protein